MRRSRAGALGWFVLLLAGCGAGTVKGGGPAGAADLAAPGPDGGWGCQGEFACQAPAFCSCARVCVPEGSCAADCDCPMGQKCAAVDGGMACVPGSDCGGQELVADAVPPNLLVVLDRSCSMRAKVGNQTKWQIAASALTTLSTTYKDKIRFGLTMFPDTDANSCSQGAIPIPVGPGNEAALQKLLAASLVQTDPYYPDGPCVTNIDTGILQAAADPGLSDPMRPSYLLLITDGAQAGCNAGGGDNGTLAALTNLFQKRNIPTFVIGFGSSVDAAHLNQFAKAGGVPSPDPNTAYYKAEDQPSLDKALGTIGSRTIGCTLKLQKTPPDPSQLFIFFDNTKEVPRDPNHVEGWDYDAQKNQVQFYGMACDDLRAGRIKDLDVVFGCDQPTPG